MGCQRPFTLNLLHYFLVCEEKPNGVDKSDSFYWYFNICEELISRKEKILDELIKWDLATHNKATSENTLNKDLDAIFSTYTKSKRSHPEDKMTSILAPLLLVRLQDGFVIKNQIDLDKLDYNSMMYIFLRMNEKQKISSLTSLLDEIDSPGKVFNLSRTEMIEIIEQMISTGYPLQISRTNNLDTIVVTKNTSCDDFMRSMIEGVKNDDKKKF